MNIPPFSIFSAVSELFVTAGVVYVIRRNWTRRPFPLVVFLAVALFEAFVNVLYMATRSARAAANLEEVSTAMKLAFAGNGLLSLLAFMAFVVLAEDGYRALELLRDDARAVDLVVLDLAMPGLPGERVLETLRRLRPDLPVIISSGYSSVESQTSWVAAGASAFVAKPYRIQDLALKLREVLDRIRPTRIARA